MNTVMDFAKMKVTIDNITISMSTVQPIAFWIPKP